MDTITKDVTIIAVDDHNLIRKETSKMLEAVGITVVLQAEHGQQALELLSSCIVLPDVCLLDLSMPVMNGLETATKMKGKYPAIKILGYSVDNDSWAITSMLTAGADGFVSKGCSLEELTTAIRQTKQVGYYFDNASARAILFYFHHKQLRK